MKYLQVQEGRSIKIDNIDEIIALNGTKTTVRVGNKSFTINYPYKTLLSIMNANDDSDILKRIEQKVGNLPVFAG